LPLCTSVPTDLTTLFDAEIEEIKTLLRPGTRHRIEAVAKLRALAIVDASLKGEHVQPSQATLMATAEQLRNGKQWQELFPGVASINITATGQGPSIDLRITKKEGTPVSLVPEGTPGASVVAVRRVDELGFYNLGANKVAEKVGLTSYQTLAVINHLGLQGDESCFKLIQIDSQRHKRYSQKTIDKIQACIDVEDIADIVNAYSAAQRSRRQSRSS
jgi:hypothetical protein